MSYIRGEGRNQGTLFPVVLDDLVPADHMCRVIDAFVERLTMSDLGFERAMAAETGAPANDPCDLLKLYLYGYLNRIRSSRRLETGCRRTLVSGSQEHCGVPSDAPRCSYSSRRRTYSLCTQLRSNPW